MENFNTVGKQNVDNMLNVLNAAFTGVERLAALNIGAARSFLESSIANTKALMSAKDIQEVASLQNSFIQPNMEKGIAYSRGVYEILAQNQKNMAKFMEAQFEELNQTLSTTLEKVGKNTPNGMEAIVNMMRNAMAATNSTYENLTKVTKQFGETAEANLSKAADAAAKTFDSAVKSVKR